MDTVARQSKMELKGSVFMKKKLIVMLAAILLGLPLLGQSAGKLAEMNKKVVGKWESADRKSYIEFRPDESCSTGHLASDGKWRIQQDTIGGWPQGDNFSCGGGILSLITPNIMTRDCGMGGEVVKFYRGAANLPKPVGILTVAVAQKVLIKQTNQTMVNNSLMTCRACWDPNDTGENDNAPLVSTYSDALTQFLVRRGYVRSSGGRLVFTAKAKQSKYYGADGGPGFRFANFRNPRILTSQIADRTHVPIEYELVPTDPTMAFFQAPHKVKATASFTFENEKWELRLLP